MTAYSYADRDRAYALIEQTEKLSDMVEMIGMGQMEANPELQAALANMTGATDLHRQHGALKYLLENIKKTHMDRIVAAARNDFTAFVEAVNPNEPCRSRVHRFLGEHLMGMEKVTGKKTAVSMPPGHAKDLCVETPVLMGDGTSKRLGDVEVGDYVITHTGASQEVVEVHDQGLRDTIILHTAHGRKIRTHPEHPFLTPAGWTPAKDLVPGDALAQQREFAIRNTSGRTREEFILAGYMMAFGAVRGRTYSRIETIDLKFRTDDPVIMDDILTLAKQMGFAGKQSVGKLYKEEVGTLTFNEPFRYWLETQGLWGLRRRTMRIPEWVFKGSYSEIGAYLGAIFSMDGTMVPRRGKQTGAMRQMRLKLRNVGLCKDLRRLLMRLGARASVNSLLENCYNWEPTYFWTLKITEAEDAVLLRKALRIVGTNRRYWDETTVPHRFFDGRYGEDKVTKIEQAEPTETRCLTVDEDHSFLADGLIVHNSTYCSRLFPAWWLGRRENKKWLQAGHTQKFAEKEFGKKLKEQILEKPGFGRVFPDVVIRTASMDEIMLSNDCSYVSKGVGQGIAGYRSHFNNIDDPYPTEKSAQSAVYRESVWHWFTNDFRTRRLPGAGELIIVTRWHSDDIVGRLEELIASGDIEPWEIINLPALSVDEHTDQLNRKVGEPLWPEFFSKNELLDLKGPMAESRWQSLYQGSPVASEGNILQRKWIKHYTDLPQWTRRNSSGDPANPEIQNRPGDPQNSSAEKSTPDSKNPFYRLRITVSVDSAEKNTVRADYSAIQVWLYATDHKHYLLDVVKGKFEFPELCEMINTTATKWGADVILVETKGAGNQYIQSQTPHAPCAVIGYNPGRDDKSIRFEGTMTLWQAGQVLLPAKAPWLETYIDELLRFPAAKNDDNVDATSQYLNWSRADGGYKRGVKKIR